MGGIGLCTNNNNGLLVDDVSKRSYLKRTIEDRTGLIIEDDGLRNNAIWEQLLILTKQLIASNLQQSFTHVSVLSNPYWKSAIRSC
ncbi:hypothetical protein RIR_jg31946.t1 [Rhizophagus irregularis DAOM 181602=DAOM 197198]|nr:hypothetical protein RIR_jg31946.t1 [Rhizophagus irregularis DAOM 181602=DAOM 197198]